MWHNFSRFKESIKVMLHKVRHTDSTHLTIFVGFFHCLPSTCIANLPSISLAKCLWIWPVDEQKIQIIHTQSFERFVDRGLSQIVIVLVIPEFSRQENILTRHITISNRLTYRNLVTVDLRRINMCVTRLKCETNTVISFFPFWNLPSPKTNFRNRNAI